MVEKVRVWAGHRPGIRRWTVEPGDCVARPTTDFYTNRVVELTNEGSGWAPKWVAVDIYNGPGHAGSVIVNHDDYREAVDEALKVKPVDSYPQFEPRGVLALTTGGVFVLLAVLCAGVFIGLLM